jgi:hypothetical protein
MGLEGLSELDILHGTFTLMFVILFLSVGLIILLKAISLKRRELISVGLTFIFLSSVWWASAFSFLFLITFNYLLDTFTYLFLGNFFVPFALVCWIYSFLEFGYPHLKKKIMTLVLIICIPYQIFMFIFLLMDPSIIGTRIGLFYYKPNLYALIFQISAILIVIITGILFSIKSIKSADPRIKWKGKFFLMAILTFVVGGTLDMGFTLNPVILVIDRLILMLSSILFYLGFLLPDKIAKWLIKDLKD